MISEILTEKEFKIRVCEWLCKNKRAFFIEPYESIEELAFYYRLPDDLKYTHTQSLADENGDLITLLKSGIYLRDWETIDGKHHRRLEFYKVLKTFTDTPDVEPFPMGYIIV
ncbi:MAG: hypothetical protein IJB45_04460 [Clostridia bacterium]|nr:hypothetical protein [Clostridia bacterium]